MNNEIFNTLLSELPQLNYNLNWYTEEGSFNSDEEEIKAGDYKIFASISISETGRTVYGRHMEEDTFESYGQHKAVEVNDIYFKYDEEPIELDDSQKIILEGEIINLINQ